MAGAGIEIQHIFPVERADGPQSETLHRLVFQVTFFNGLFPVQPLEKYIGNGSQQMEVLGAGNIDEESQDRADVDKVADLIEQREPSGRLCGDVEKIGEPLGYGKRAAIVEMALCGRQCRLAALEIAF